MEQVVTALQALLKLLEEYASPAKWQPLAFRVGWENFGAPVQSAGSRKTPLGRVELRGHVKRTAGATVEIANLPRSQWPAAGKVFTVYSNLAAGGIYIDAGGIVTFSFGTATDISLEGITFDTEQ
jgi:hypothetical protein